MASLGSAQASPAWRPTKRARSISSYPSGQGRGWWAERSWRRSPFLVETELLETLDAALGEPERGVVVGVVDPEAAVFGFELIGKRFQPLLGLAKKFGGIGDGADKARGGHDQAALAAAVSSRALRQFHGSSSWRRDAGRSAMRARTSASQARGSTPFSLAV